MATGRVFEPELTALLGAEPDADGLLALRCPAVGLWRGAPEPGAVIYPGALLGELEILGVVHRLRAPDAVAGAVVRVGGQHRGREPLGHGDLLVAIDPSASVAAAAGASASAAGSAAATDAGGLVFRAPTSGRFYGRPTPDKPAFVAVGDIVEPGRTLCLLEVMKTFNRVTYAAAGGLPARARVTAIVPKEEEDLAAGAPILRLEPA
jgi:acetyl-CoA carboxylase biotin carboxyl carrier protein